MLRNMVRPKAKPNICPACFSKDKQKVPICTVRSQYGPDVHWCPRCGYIRDWWLQIEYHANKMIEAYEISSKNRM